MMLKSKKGGGEAISAIIMFIAVIAVSTGLVVSFKNYASETQNSLGVQNDIINNQLRTSISIINIVYDSSTNYTNIFLKNTGQSKLVTDEFDLFLDEEYLTNYSVYLASNQTQEVRILEPQTTALFRVQKYVPSGTHEVKMVSGYGGTGDEEFFNN